jgi:hypothetical protein
MFVIEEGMYFEEEIEHIWKFHTTGVNFYREWDRLHHYHHEPVLVIIITIISQ